MAKVSGVCANFVMKKKIVSFALVFMLLVSIFPNMVFAASKTTITVQDAETGAAISGCVINIKNSNGSVLHFTVAGGSYSYNENGETTNITTNIGGKAIVQGLPSGRYSAVQIKNAKGYEDNLQTKSFSSTDSGLIFYNNKKYGAISIRVADSGSGNSLSRVAFTIQDSSGSPVKFILSGGVYTYSAGSGSTTTTISGNSGRVDVFQLPVGKYVLTQTASDTYHNPISPIVFSVENTGGSQKVISLKNNTKPGKLVISSPVAGTASYSLYSGGTPLKFSGSNGSYNYSSRGNTTLINSVNGKATLSNIPAGIYTLRINSAPSGYSAVVSSKTVQIPIGQSTNMTVNFRVGGGGGRTTPAHPGTTDPVEPTTNAQTVQGNAASMKVVDETGSGVKGVKIAVHNEKGGTVRAGSTDKNGVFSISGLTNGSYSYFIQETPKEYFYNSSKYIFTVEKNGDVVGFSDLKVTTKAVYVVYPDKVAGAVFSAIDSYGDTVASATTNNKGVAVFKGLRDGAYRIIQTKAPDNHELYVGETTVMVSGNFNNYKNPVVVSNEKATLPSDPPPTEPVTTYPNEGDLPYDTMPEIVETQPPQIEETVPAASLPVEKEGSGISTFLIILFFVIGAGAGFAAGFLLLKKMKNKKNNADNGDETDDAIAFDGKKNKKRFSKSDKKDIEETQQFVPIKDYDRDRDLFSNSADEETSISLLESNGKLDLSKQDQDDDFGELVESDEYDDNVVVAPVVIDNEDTGVALDTDDFGELENEPEDVPVETDDDKESALPDAFSEDDYGELDDSSFTDESDEANESDAELPEEEEETLDFGEDTEEIGEQEDSFEFEGDSEFLDLNEDDTLDEDLVGFLPSQTETVEPEDSQEVKELDSVYGDDVGRIEQAPSDIQEESNKTFDLDAASDVGEIENVTSSDKTNVSPSDEDINKIYGNDTGELIQEEQPEIVSVENPIEEDEETLDVGELTSEVDSSKKIDNGEDENIDNIYGEDVGDL